MLQRVMTMNEVDLKLTTIMNPHGERTSVRTFTVTGPDVPDPDQLRHVTFVESRWVAVPADMGADVKSAAAIAIGSTVVLNEKRMCLEARPGADPEFVDENSGYYGEPPKPETVVAMATDALKDGLAALDQVRKLTLLPEDVDAKAAADAVAAFCAAVTERKPWEGPVGTTQVEAVSVRLSDLAHEVQRAADLVQSAAEAWDDVTCEVSALIDAARTGVGSDGSPELQFAHFDDEPEPEPEDTSPVMNLVMERYGRSSTTAAAVHRGVRKNRWSTVPQCGAAAFDRFSQTAEAVTCKRCLRLQSEDNE